MKEPSLEQYLITDVGGPFIIGLAVGYFTKKMLKLALFLGGAAVVLLFVTEYYGFTQISDQDLINTTETVTRGAGQFGDFLTERLAHITSKGVSAVAGFAVGLKFG